MMANVETVELKSTEVKVVILLKHHSLTLPISAEACNEFQSFQEGSSDFYIKGH